jgi:hypothetical protein
LIFKQRELKLEQMTPDEKRPSFWAHAEKVQERVNQWPEWKRDAANAALVSKPPERRAEPEAEPEKMR